MLSLFDKEASYDAGPGSWATGSCSLLDFDDASAQEVWDDTLQGDTDVITGKEFVDVHEIARQSVRLNYTEPRVKPNTLAGLLGLSMGTVATTQDGTETAYRHKITPAASVSLPSIGIQTLREGGVQRKSTGMKADSFTLANNGPYFRCQSGLIGSGTRTTASDTFTASITENWLRWGNAKIYVKNTGGSPITVPATPDQTAANLGGSEVNFSTRVLEWSLNWQNSLPPDFGYRASTGDVRGNFHPVRRRATLTMKFETDSATEATELAYYLSQNKLALELNCNMGVLIDAQGAFLYGFIIIIPSAQLTSMPRGQTNEFENLDMVAEVRDDGTNDEMVAWVYNARATYLV